ncbi:MAG: dockerin type I domain-containing protein [Phycisphaerales bacterium]|nr:dockerin type I domain-containing protein [Phycisphaerales bacterium]
MHRSLVLDNSSRLLSSIAICASVGLLSDGAIAGPPAQTQLPTTLHDYFEPGTQESTLIEPMLTSNSCSFCHQFTRDGNDNEIVAPYDNWRMSMMAQAARDPVWLASLAIANQDADFGGDTCIRCHAPAAWLSGRSVPTDASAFVTEDWEGVTCHFCHRIVDPVADKSNPPEDEPILAALAADGLLPAAPGNSRFVVDPIDVRRGPLDDVPMNLHGVPIIVSPFHYEGNLCGTCHDVSNALYTRNVDGTYALNSFDAEHPTLDPHEMMPEQRTFSEWKNSTFANGGVFFPDGRFGGDDTGLMESCQDCHMPKHSGGACFAWDSPPFFIRPDVAEHSFVGANTWAIGAVYEYYGKSESGLTQEAVEINRARTQIMLRNASDMQILQLGPQLKTRVINVGGHKLPTGYPEGRRMWLNVQFFDTGANLIAENGAYDFGSATLHTDDTKVYESTFGIDSAVAAATGIPEGPTFHLVLNNIIVKDNRIPPMGFTNAAFQAIRAAPVAASYADNQHWDDTLFAIPKGAVEAVVTLYYQTTSREYIEFLRDANTTNSAGQTAYDLWVSQGMSAPVDMDIMYVKLAAPRLGDINHDSIVNITDLLAVISGWGQCPPPNICASDVNGDNLTNIADLLTVISNWGA